MKKILGAAAWLAAAAMLPAQAAYAQHEAGTAATAAQPSEESKRIDEAGALVRAHHPDQAVVLLDRVIAAEEAAHKGETRLIYCAGSVAEGVMYAGLATQQKRSALVLNGDWSQAIFLKGFALIDLNRPDEAKPLFDRALALSPLNAQFLGETGEWHKIRHEWDKAYDYFRRGTDNAFLMPTEVEQKFFKRRGLRGMGFVLIEQGRLDEAEAKYREALAIDPDDAAAKQELQYIAEQRAKRT
jgi:tetratricopeptide (TPR) repeat protein